MQLWSLTHTTLWMMKFKPTRPKGEEIWSRQSFTPPPHNLTLTFDSENWIKVIAYLYLSTLEMFKLGWIENGEKINYGQWFHFTHRFFFTLTFDPEIWLKVNKHFLPTHTQWVNFTGAQLNQREGEKNLLQTKIF